MKDSRTTACCNESSTKPFQSGDLSPKIQRLSKIDLFALFDIVGVEHDEIGEVYSFGVSMCLIIRLH